MDPTVPPTPPSGPPPSGPPPDPFASFDPSGSSSPVWPKILGIIGAVVVLGALLIGGIFLFTQGGDDGGDDSDDGGESAEQSVDVTDDFSDFSEDFSDDVAEDDADDDGIPDNEDTDDDGDGIPDVDDPDPGVPDPGEDGDGDGIPDIDDPDPGDPGDEIDPEDPPAADLDLLRTDPRPAVDAWIDAAGDGAKALEVVLYTDYGFATIRDPEHPAKVLEYGWRDGEVQEPDGPEEPFPGTDLEAETFRLTNVNWDALPGLVANAPERAGLPRGEVTHVIVTSDAPFSSRFLFRIYVTAPNGSDYVVATIDGQPAER